MGGCGHIANTLIIDGTRFFIDAGNHIKLQTYEEIQSSEFYQNVDDKCIEYADYADKFYRGIEFEIE